MDKSWQKPYDGSKDLMKLDVGSGDGYLKDFLGDPVHNAKILAGEYKKGEARL